MFYAYIPLFSYMGANLGQMPAAIAAAAAARDSSRRPGYGVALSRAAAINSRLFCICFFLVSAPQKKIFEFHETEVRC